MTDLTSCLFCGSKKAHGENRIMTMSAKSMLFISVFSVFMVFSCGVSQCAEPFAAPSANKGTIAGRIMMKDGGPLSGGNVLFYDAAAGPPPDPEKYERAPDFVRDIGDDGGFEADLPAGTYYLGAVRRTSGERVGPPREGDYVYRSIDEKGRSKEFHVKAGVRLDAGTQTGAVPLKAGAHAKGLVGTAIEGVIVGMDGAPVADAVVVAFLSSSVGGKPLFVSDKTGRDGKYVLRVTEGEYYLRVRSMFAGGPPEPGQIVGYYGDGVPATVSVKRGEIRKGINFRAVLFPGRGPFSGTAPARR